ncbi:MAG TPA: DUF664 domain-containing protein [Jatrophihabitans sp.]|jgi:hypothetical protein|nr:DUF664 domain-containing protein [Jatrophihabitans sp.]
MQESISVAELLCDAFSRVREEVIGTVTGLTTEQLQYRPSPRANSIGWLIWHLTRVQDDHVAGAAGLEQVWTSQGLHQRFGLPFDTTATGYGQRSEEVAAVRVSAQLLIDYHDAVYRQTVDYVTGLTEADLARVVDERWDPPVTLGVRLVSVLSDDLQHVGQAGYLRGQLS